MSVFGADLWISPTENHGRFQSLEIDHQAVPISVDAIKGPPFADGSFDRLFTVDSYYYFGDTKELTGGHPILAEDISMIEAEGSQYFNLSQMIAKVISSFLT